MVFGDPALIVTLVSASGDTGGFGTRQGLSNLDGFLALLDRLGSTTGLGEESLDPGLVHEVKSAAENASQEKIKEDAAILSVTYVANCTWRHGAGGHGACNVHLRVEDAGGGLDNAGQTAVSLDLEDLTLGVGKDSEEFDNDILGLHVQDKREGQGLSLAGGDLDIVADGRQVAEDTGA